MQRSRHILGARNFVALQSPAAASWSEINRPLSCLIGYLSGPWFAERPRNAIQTRIAAEHWRVVFRRALLHQSGACDHGLHRFMQFYNFERPRHRYGAGPYCSDIFHGCAMEGSPLNLCVTLGRRDCQHRPDSGRSSIAGKWTTAARESVPAVHRYPYRRVGCRSRDRGGCADPRPYPEP